METNKKVEWKKCPKCERFIPKHWERDDKCGWDITQTTLKIETLSNPTCAHLPRFCPDCGERLK